MTYKQMKQHAHWDSAALYWADNDDPDMVWIWTGSRTGWQSITRQLADDFEPTEKPPKEARVGGVVAHQRPSNEEIDRFAVAWVDLVARARSGDPLCVLAEAKAALDRMGYKPL